MRVFRGSVDNALYTSACNASYVNLHILLPYFICIMQSHCLRNCRARATLQAVVHPWEGRPEMPLDEFEKALMELGWRHADFARKTDIAPTTVWRWASGRAEVPRWASEYLAAMLEIQRLHKRFIATE